MTTGALEDHTGGRTLWSRKMEETLFVCLSDLTLQFQPCCCSLISGDFFHMPNWLHPKKLYNHHAPASWWGWECCSVYWQIVGMSLHHPSSYTVCFIDRCAVQQMNDTSALWWALVHTAGHPCGNSSLHFNSLQTLQKKYNKNSFPNHLCLWVHWNLLKLQKLKNPTRFGISSV